MNMSDEQFHVFEEWILALIYSNRYKKGDDFLQHVDFTIIWGVLYSYSETERIKTLSDYYFALLFHHFYLLNSKSSKGSHSINKSQLNWAKSVEEEMKFLDNEALITINNARI